MEECMDTLAGASVALLCCLIFFFFLGGGGGGEHLELQSRRSAI
jgi:hypothetical protein